MDSTARRLRNEAKQFSNRETPTASRYSPEFRDEVVRLARERRELGVPVSRIAGELGVRGRTLSIWLRSAPKRRLRRVKVAPVAPVAETGVPSAPLLAVSSGAMRIEGLDLESVARLIRLLS
jgi:transposase-like protein